MRNIFFSKWKLVIYLPALLGFFLALLAIFIVGVDVVKFPDAKDYLAAANTILQDFSYPRYGSLPFFRPPLYSFFISLIWLIFPGSLFAIKFAQAVLHALTCWIIYKTAFEIFKNQILSIISSLICAVTPFLVFQTTDVQTETLHTFLISTAVFLLTKILYREKISFLLTFFAGFVFGVAALCRPSALPVGLCVIFILFLLKSKKSNLRLCISAMITGVIGIAISIAPWAIYNKATINEWVLISDTSGYALWAGNHPEVIRTYEGVFATPEEFWAFNVYINEKLAAQKIDEWEKTVGYSSLSFKERESLWQKEAIGNMLENPYITLRLWFWKTWAFWKPYLNPQSYSLHLVLVSLIFSVPLYLLSLLGALKLWSEYKKFVILITAMFIVTTFIHAIVIGQIRYRVPYVDPYLCILSAVAFFYLFPKSFTETFQIKAILR